MPWPSRGSLFTLVLGKYFTLVLKWMYPEDGLLVHGNHFMAFIPDQVSATYKPFSVDSLYRVPRVRQVLARCRHATDPIAVRELIATAMRDHFGAPDSVCNHPRERRHPLEQTQTIASTIVDLTTGDYYLATGTPCANHYLKLPRNLYD
jgi:isopenicillin-N N-acyltransferase-like protein